MTDKTYLTYIISRIMDRSKPIESGCILFPEVKHAYGLISITTDGKRKNVPVHRAMYMAVNDCLNLPRTIVIRHKCDTPRCVNIDHLFKGSSGDNIQDCIERGRRSKRYKEHSRARTYSPEIVEKIKQATGRNRDIAIALNVPFAYVSRVRTGKIRKFF